MPAAEVQRIAARACSDGLNHKAIIDLSKIGTSGVYPNRCHSDLVAKLPDMHLGYSISKFNVQYRVPGFFARVLSRDHFALLPHELFATIYARFPQVFTKDILGGSADNPAKFWEAAKDHPSMIGHPMLRKRDPFSKAVPIALHGDGVAVSGCGRSWSRSVDVYSWASLLSYGETLTTNFMIYMMYANLITEASMKEFWALLTWSFYWLFVGRWPSRDHNGKEWPAGSEEASKAGTHLANGYYGVLFVVRGDLEHMAKGFKMPWPTSLSPCALCRCNSSDTPWTDPSPTAAWRATVWSNREWHIQHPHGHCIFTQVPGVGITSFVPDVMHVLHLGVYQYVFGSILKYLTHVFLPGTQQENLRTVWEMIKEGYNVFNVKYKYSEIRITMYAGAGFPLLKGKAAEVKGLALPLCKVVEDLLPEDCQIHRWMRKLLFAIVQVEQILTKHKSDARLPRDAALEFSSSCSAIVSLNTALGIHFHRDGEMLFNHTIKFHYTQHLAIISAYINPRLAWCYSGEDLLQKVRQIVQSCFKGTKHVAVPQKAMLKYIRGLNYRLAGGFTFR